jgi:hypothetical protein
MIRANPHKSTEAAERKRPGFSFETPPARRNCRPAAWRK